VGQGEQLLLSSIRDVVIAYLDDREIPYVVDASGSIVGMLSASEKGPWTVYIGMLEADDQVVVHSAFNPPVPEAAREAIAIFLTRANFGILHGNFELDLDDGELRYKTSIDVRGAQLTEALFDNLIVANVSMFDRFIHGIEAVVHGVDPLEAIAAVEGT
jgi:hypothetical protein